MNVTRWNMRLEVGHVLKTLNLFIAHAAMPLLSSAFNPCHACDVFCTVLFNLNVNSEKKINQKGIFYCIMIGSRLANLPSDLVLVKVAVRSFVW